MTQREEFEAWAKQRGWPLHDRVPVHGPTSSMSETIDRYMEPAWDAWQAAQAAQPAQPFAWYDPSADKFTRDLDDPSMNRGAILWRLFLDARPIQAPELSDAEIRAWWGSENGLEDMNMCKIDDFTKTVRAVITRLNAKVPA